MWIRSADPYWLVTVSSFQGSGAAGRYVTVLPTRCQSLFSRSGADPSAAVPAPLRGHEKASGASLGGARQTGRPSSVDNGYPIRFASPRCCLSKRLLQFQLDSPRSGTRQDTTRPTPHARGNARRTQGLYPPPRMAGRPPARTVMLQASCHSPRSRRGGLERPLETPLDPVHSVIRAHFRRPTCRVFPARSRHRTVYPPAGTVRPSTRTPPSLILRRPSEDVPTKPSTLRRRGR